MYFLVPCSRAGHKEPWWNEPCSCSIYWTNSQFKHEPSSHQGYCSLHKQDTKIWVAPATASLVHGIFIAKSTLWLFFCSQLNMLHPAVLCVSLLPLHQNAINYSWLGYEKVSNEIAPATQWLKWRFIILITHSTTTKQNITQLISTWNPYAANDQCLERTSSVYGSTTTINSALTTS